MSTLCLYPVYCTHVGPGCDRGCEAKSHASDKAFFEFTAAEFAKNKDEAVAKAAADLERSTDEGCMVAPTPEQFADAKRLETEAKGKQLEAETKAK